MKSNHPLFDPTPAVGGGTPPPAAKPATAVVAPAASAAAKPADKPASTSASDAADLGDPFDLPKKPDSTASKTTEKTTVADDEEKLAPADLRKIAKQRKQELETAGGKVKTLEAKIADYEKRGIDTSALTQRLTALETERDNALKELRAAKQEASPEFKEKYEKPFHALAERARKQVTELSVTNPEDGSVRPATWEDFAAIYSMPTGKAIEKANELFGASSSYVINLREKLLDLDTARSTALEEEKSNFKKKSEQEIAEQAREHETVNKQWAETNTRLSESVPEYKDDPTDAEAVESRKHALAVFDTPVKGADRQDFIQKKIMRDAHIRQRVGAYAVQKLKISRLESEKAALQAQVEELKGAAPGKTRRSGGESTPVATDEDWDAGMVKAVTG